MKHNKLQQLVINRLTVSGNGFNIVSSNRKGRPDISGHVGMIAVYVEVKVGKDTPRSAQRKTLLEIIDKGGIGLVVHEKHYRTVFLPYIDKMEQDIKKCLPCNLIGKPIPEELLVKPFEDVVEVTGTIVPL